MPLVFDVPEKIRKQPKSAEPGNRPFIGRLLNESELKVNYSIH